MHVYTFHAIYNIKYIHMFTYIYIPVHTFVAKERSGSRRLSTDSRARRYELCIHLYIYLCTHSWQKKDRDPVACLPTVVQGGMNFVCIYIYTCAHIHSKRNIGIPSLIHRQSCKEV